jgi:putative transcriptional regulator
MTKRNIGDEILQGMEDAISYVRGKKTSAVVHKVEIPDEIDVRLIRENLHLSRQAFADRFGFSSRTLQHWEQGDRNPQGSAKVLLLLLQREPAIIESILSQNAKNRKVASRNKKAA